MLFKLTGDFVLHCAAAASRRRKKRTSIDTILRIELERRFNVNSKPTSEEIAMVADELQMEKEVFIVYFSFLTVYFNHFHFKLNCRFV